MSLDYPYYEEFCRRKHRAAWWWLVGDRLYYLGLLAAVLAVPVGGVAITGWLLGFGKHWQVATALAAITFPIGAVVFLIGSSLKGYAYTIAERDGISAREVYTRSSVPDAVSSTTPDRDALA